MISDASDASKDFAPESERPIVSELASNRLTMTVLMTLDSANLAGNVHGGHILKLLDQVAFACASRYAGSYVVTLSVNQVIFRKPIRVGELVTLLASSSYTGTSSMEVGIRVMTEDIRSKQVRHTNRCYFTMVAVDETGKPVRVPPLQPASSEGRRRFEANALFTHLLARVRRISVELLTPR